MEVKDVQQSVKDATVNKRERQYRLKHGEFILTILITGFVALAILASFIPYFTIDLKVTRGIQYITDPNFAAFMAWISFIGFSPQVQILVGLLLAGMYVAGLRWEAVVGGINAVSVTLMNFLLKTIVNRPRPSTDVVNVMRSLNESSFPSGHVMLYMSFFGYCFFITYIMLKKGALRTGLLIFWLLLILLIGPSRIYLGAHWASDVLGAYLFGMLWLYGTIYFYEWGKRKYFPQQPVA